MYDQLSDKGQDAFKAAHKIARASGKEVLDSDSILLGLTQAGGYTVAARALKEAGLWESLTSRVSDLGPLLQQFAMPFSRTDDVKELLGFAAAHAVVLCHHYIDTEHILLALIGRCTLLTEVCNEHEVNPARLHKDVHTILGIDVNTDDDYKNYRIQVASILDENRDDREVVKDIFNFLSSNLPHQVRS